MSRLKNRNNKRTKKVQLPRESNELLESRQNYRNKNSCVSRRAMEKCSMSCQNTTSLRSSTMASSSRGRTFSVLSLITPMLSLSTLEENAEAGATTMPPARVGNTPFPPPLLPFAKAFLLPLSLFIRVKRRDSQHSFRPSQSRCLQLLFFRRKVSSGGDKILEREPGEKAADRFAREIVFSGRGNLSPQLQTPSLLFKGLTKKGLRCCGFVVRNISLREGMR